MQDLALARKFDVAGLVVNQPDSSVIINNYKITLNWQRLVELRPATIANDKVPPYLFLPEVRFLIANAPTIEQAVFFETLFVLGTRLGEALMLTRQSFNFVDDGVKVPHVMIPTLKQKQKKIPVHLRNLEPGFVPVIRQYVNSVKSKPNAPIFNKSRRTYENWFEKMNKQLSFHCKVTPRTMRHSCAVHLLLSGLDILSISRYLRHSSVKSTEIYLKVPMALLEETRPEPKFR